MQTQGQSFSRLTLTKTALFAFGAFVLFLTGGISSARAQDAESACRNDAYRLCSRYIPNEGAVKVCMRRNIRHLSPACRAGFTRHATRGRTHVRHKRHYRKRFHHRRHSHHRRHRR